MSDDPTLAVTFVMQGIETSIDQSKRHHMDQNIEVCGTICTDCDHFSECGGCKVVQGRPFWTAYVGVDECPIHGCCVGERHLDHCGACPELICERFTRFRDPDMTDEESEAALETMKNRLLTSKTEEQKKF